MPRTKNQKLRTLYIARYFLEYSDNNHVVNASEIIDHLKDDYGFVCERRSVYRDIAVLRDEFGMDIGGVQGGKYKLLSLKYKIDTTKMKDASFLAVIVGLGDYAYKRPDGVYVIPIGCLKN